jgi:zinc protease
MTAPPEPLVSAARAASSASSLDVRLDGTARFGGLCAARYRLPNGLTVILMPDDRAPVFAYQTWFKVGSRDEESHRTGLAHLFEHLMFKGTKKRASGELDKEMERRGSQTNAATWVDWTYYHEALAARGDNLATVVDFEVDRMVDLVLDEQTFRSELEVVKNERRLSVDDSVIGRLGEKLFELAYTTHPYRWPTIGAMAHLEASSLADLNRFYKTFYAPNNAVVVVVGDLDPSETLSLLARRYGVLASQPIVRPPRSAEPVQRERRHALLEMPVMAPQLILGYHAPAQLDPTFPALEMVSDALTSGDSSRLYRKLVIDEEVATEVDGFCSPFAEPGLYEVLVTLREGIEPDAVVALIQSELEKIGEGGLVAREVNKAKNALELGWLDSLKDAEGCAEALGHYEATFGDFAEAFTSAERYDRVDAAALKAVARATFREDNRTVVVAVPGGEEPHDD